MYVYFIYQENPGAKDFLNKGLVDSYLYESIFKNKELVYKRVIKPISSKQNKISGEKRKNTFACEGSKGKKMICTYEKPLVDVLDKLDKTINSITTYSNANTMSIESVRTISSSIKNCTNILMAMKLDMKKHMAALGVFVDKPYWREAFILMTPEHREYWVHNVVGC